MSFENQTLRANVDTLLEVANVAAATRPPRCRA